MNSVVRKTIEGIVAALVSIYLTFRMSLDSSGFETRHLIMLAWFFIAALLIMKGKRLIDKVSKNQRLVVVLTLLLSVLLTVLLQDRLLPLRQTGTVSYSTIERIIYNIGGLFVCVFICYAAITLVVIELKRFRSLRWTPTITRCLIPVICVAIIEVISNIHLQDISFGAILLNVLIWGLITAILVNLLEFKKIGWYLVISFALLIGIVNHFVIQFKAYPLMPADVLSIGTGMAVMGNYHYELSTSISVGLILFVIAVCMISLLLPNPAVTKVAWLKHKALSATLIVGMIAWISAVDFCSAYQIKQDFWNTANTCSKYGFTTSFISFIQQMKIQKPDGYSTKAAKEILNSYTSSAVVGEDADKPHLIAIMNETFCDIRKWGNLGKTENIMWFLDSLDDCLEKGSMYVSTRGGGTCNTEFEFLTGNSMLFSPNIFPYTLFDFNGVPSLVSTLNEQGYQTIAMHASGKTNFKRNSVYRALGFDRFYALGDTDSEGQPFFPAPNDYECYKRIIELVETSETPSFIFNVTIQNHGGYDGGPSGLEHH